MRSRRLLLAVAAALRVSAIALGTMSSALVALAQTLVTVTRSDGKPNKPFVVVRSSNASNSSCWMSLQTAGTSGLFSATIPAVAGTCNRDEIAVFASGVAPKWKALVAPTTTVALNDPLTVVPLNVHIFLGSNSTDAASRTKVSNWVKKANTLFGDRNPFGITFDYNPASFAVHPYSDDNLGVGEDCGESNTLNPTFYDAASITVYVVSKLARGETSLGKRCEDTANLIYISYRYAVSGTLAHEIGHVLLGLEHFGRDKVADRDGIEARNLMADGYILSKAERKLHFDSLTAGQAIRARQGNTSWLSRSSPTIAWMSGSAPVLKCTQTGDPCPDSLLRWK